MLADETSRPGWGIGLRGLSGVWFRVASGRFDEQKHVVARNSYFLLCGFYCENYASKS